MHQGMADTMAANFVVIQKMNVDKIINKTILLHL